MMTDEAYIAAYQALVNAYSNNQAGMAEHLAAMQTLKDRYLKERKNGVLPVVP